MMVPMDALMRMDEPESTAFVAADTAGPPTPVDIRTATADQTAANGATPSVTADEPVMLQRAADEPTDTAGGGFLGIAGLDSAGGLSGILMIGGVLLMSAILLGRLKRGRRNRSKSMPTPREQINAIRSRAESRTQIEAYKVEAHEFTRQLAAILDTKAARLEQLIADADDRLARLGVASQTTPPPVPPPSPAVLPVGGPRMPSVDPPTPDEHERIYRLADAGMDSVEIARQTGKPTGQVELILALRA